MGLAGPAGPCRIVLLATVVLIQNCDAQDLDDSTNAGSTRQGQLLT